MAAASCKIFGRAGGALGGGLAFQRAFLHWVVSFLLGLCATISLSGRARGCGAGMDARVPRCQCWRMPVATNVSVSAGVTCAVVVCEYLESGSLGFCTEGCSDRSDLEIWSGLPGP